MDINLFTQAMRAEFINSMQAAGRPALVDPFLLDIGSTARIENYAWMTPAPGYQRYKGYRRLAQLSDIKYTVENYQYDATITVKTRDVEDDVVGGYKMRFKDLAEKAKAPFRNRFALSTLASGKANTCFDGTNFFNTTHTLGGYATSIPGTGAGQTGGNLLTATTAGSDAVVHRFVVMLANPDSPLKPLIYQNRKPATLITNAGTPASEIAERAEYVGKLEAAVAYGYWWDAVMVEFANTPTVLELIAGLQAANTALLQFYLPTALPQDPKEYPHEQHVWAPDNTAVVCSAGIATLMGQVLNESYFGISQAGSTSGITPNNIYFKKFTLIPTNQLNTGNNGL